MSILVNAYFVCVATAGAAAIIDGVRHLNMARKSHQPEHYLPGIISTAMGAAFVLTPFILSSSPPITPPPSSS